MARISGHMTSMDGIRASMDGIRISSYPQSRAYGVPMARFVGSRRLDLRTIWFQLGKLVICRHGQDDPHPRPNYIEHTNRRKE
jgi:hypothetical protein